MERGIAVLGIAVMVGLAWLVSVDRRAIDWRSVAISLGLQVAIAFVCLRTAFGAGFFEAANDGAVAFIAAANAGIDFVFGRWPESVRDGEGAVVRLPFVFAIRVLPVIIFMSSVFSVLYHFGILQRVVEWTARGLRRVLPISGAEALTTVANIFLGMTEAPLMVRPYIEAMTRSELFLVMTSGLASVAGSVLVAYMGMVGPEYSGHLIAASFMSAPAAIMYAKLMIPEIGLPQTSGTVRLPRVPRTSVNVIDAAAEGASEGLRLALNIGAMLIAFVSLIFLLDSILQLAGAKLGVPGLSFGKLLGFVLAPLAWLLGVPWADAAEVGELLGVKTVLNEFISYDMLSAAVKSGSLEPRSIVIASYAMCGFANFGSLAILLGGLGEMARSRRGDIARDGMRAILAGSLASFTTGALAGILL